MKNKISRLITPPPASTKSNLNYWITLFCVVVILVALGSWYYLSHKIQVYNSPGTIITQGDIRDIAVSIFNSPPGILHEWTSYPKKVKRNIRAELFVLFPVIFKRTPKERKWQKIQDYLRLMYGIKPNYPRDLLRKKSDEWPGFEAQALNHIEEICTYLKNAEKLKLSRYWKVLVDETTAVTIWLNLIKPYVTKALKGEKANEFIEKFKGRCT